jgi:hypothetical protein
VGGAGVAGTAVTWWTARRKVPAEVDNIIVTGAEMTVQSALAIASAEAARADRAEQRSLELEQRLDAALARVDMLQTALDAVRDELYDIKNHKEDRL